MIQNTIRIATQPVVTTGVRSGLGAVLAQRCLHTPRNYSNVTRSTSSRIYREDFQYLKPGPQDRQYSRLRRPGQSPSTWTRQQSVMKPAAPAGSVAAQRMFSTSTWWKSAPATQETAAAGATASPIVETKKSRFRSAYGWLDREAEDLIARSYARHRSIAAKTAFGETHRSFPPSLECTTEELHALEKNYHYAPKDWVDKLAYRLMRFLRVFTHAFFREKYDHHAVTLETVAAVPGMVAAFHRHLRSLRTMRRDHGWINPLLEEAENERMHLLIFMKVTHPNWLERAVVFAAQGAYTLAYSVLYFFNGRAAHRLVGYLEEEAHRAYTDYLHAIRSGAIANKPAPKIAREYYHLPEDATMRDVVLHVRADECMHRDTNHHLGDKYMINDLDSAPTGMQTITGGGEEKAKEAQFRKEDVQDART